MLRYGLLSQALIYHVARGNTDLKPMVTDGLESEYQTLKDIKGSKPQAIWVWILDFWLELHQKGHIDRWVMKQAQLLVFEGRRAVKVVFTYIGCQVPFGWV